MLEEGKPLAIHVAPDSKGVATAEIEASVPRVSVSTL